MKTKAKQPNTSGRKLAFKATTVYLDSNDLAWLQRHAAQLQVEEGQPISMTNIVRRVLRQYRDRVEGEVSPPVPEDVARTECPSRRSG